MHDALTDAPADDPPWLAGLNPPQREAVETLDGPLLVLSGAGTGKTRVLTARLALLLAAKRAWPSQILAVTFTNRAANEMRERVEALIGEMSAGLWLGTFHALGLRILRRHPELVGLRPSFSILDPDDQERLLKQVLADANVDAKHWPARQLSAIVQRWKDKGWRPEQVPADEAGNFANGRAPALYEAYQERLEQLNAVDFGDLLLHNLTIFQRDAGVLAQYQERFRYILVDEYQDTNIAQYLWLRLLAQKHRNICCVGDDDQSIYAWRGAEVGNILRFENDFDGARIVRLEQNYRSTGDILGAASGLIANNRGRLGKTLWTTREDSRPITVHTVPDGEAEARLVGAEIEALQRAGTGLGRMAVLMRASFQMRAFEERFVALGLNYRVIGGPRFYERREVRDAVAYLRAVLFPEDDLAFERIVNLPKRGIGGATLQPVHRLARAERIPLGEAARRLVETEDLKARARNALAGFCRAIDGWRAPARQRTPCRPRGCDPRRERLPGDVAEGQGAGRAGPAGKSGRTRAADRPLQYPRRVSGACLPGDGGRRRQRGGQRLADDAARRQGARIRHCVPSGLGGGPVPAPARAWRERALPAWRRNAASPMSASPARAGMSRSPRP